MNQQTVAQTVAVQMPPMDVMQKEKLKTSVGQELGFEQKADGEVQHFAPEIDAEVRASADKSCEALFSLDLNNETECEALVKDIGDYGKTATNRASEANRFLRQPLAKLMESSDEGNKLAKTMIDMKIMMEDLNPHKYDLTPGFVTKYLGFIPFVGTPMRRYFSKYQKADDSLETMFKTLMALGEERKRDNLQLIERRKQMRALTKQLAKVVAKGQFMMQNIEAHCATLEQEDAKRKFLEEEILFPLKQRVIDMGIQLQANLQGIMAFAMYVTMNKEAIRGVDRTCTTTRDVLDIAITLAFARAGLKMTMKAITAMNEFTTKIMTQNADELGMIQKDVQKMAGGGIMDIDALKAATDKVIAAIDDEEKFRREALPRMSEMIKTLNDANGRAEEKVKKMERGEAARNRFETDLAA